MKINTKSQDVTTSGVEESNGFQIEGNAIAFQVLSANIYSNVFKAIVRELSTNAYDAHVDAGIGDKPFQVTLPNNLESNFIVRDFGKGISPDNIANIYTTYFSSTKRSNNKAIGCLGLGSKSPFAYVDQFQVNSYYGGRKYSYTMYKGEDNTPLFSLLSEDDTTESSGLEVIVPCKRSDFYRFVESASEIYYWFNVRPTIIGAEVEYDDTEPLFEDKVAKWSRLYSYNSGYVYVLMGQVLHKTEIKSTLRCDVVLKAKIGDCSIAANRESLHIDPKTRDWIDKTLKLATRNIEDNIDKEVSAGLDILDRTCISKKYELVSNYKYDKLQYIVSGVYEIIYANWSFDCHRPIVIESGSRIDSERRRAISQKIEFKPFIIVNIKDAEKAKGYFHKIDFKLDELVPRERKKKPEKSIKIYSTENGRRVYIPNIEIEKVCYFPKECRRRSNSLSLPKFLGYEYYVTRKTKGATQITLDMALKKLSKEGREFAKYSDSIHKISCLDNIKDKLPDTGRLGKIKRILKISKDEHTVVLILLFAGKLKKKPDGTLIELILKKWPLLEYIRYSYTPDNVLLQYMGIK